MIALSLILILTLIIIIFSIQNADPVSLKFLYWSFEVPKVVVLFLSLLLGVVICTLINIMNIIKQKNKIDNKPAEKKEPEQVNNI